MILGRELFTVTPGSHTLYIFGEETLWSRSEEKADHDLQEWRWMQLAQVCIQQKWQIFAHNAGVF